MKRFRSSIIALIALFTCVSAQNPTMTVREVDGWPKLTNPTTLIFPNGSVSRNGSVLTITTGGAPSGDALLQIRNAADSAWINLGLGAESATVAHVPIRLQGTGANVIEPLNTTPSGSEYALPVRNIVSGTQLTDPTDRDARVLGRIKIYDGTDVALVSGSGSLQVTCDNCGGSTFADNAAFTFGTTSILNIGAVVDDTATNTVTENSAGNPRMSANRVLYSNLRDSSGNEIISATANPGGGDRGVVVREARVGQATMAASFPMVISSDQSAIPSSQSGTWTVQPGNTANSTAWLFKISQTTTDNDVDANITNATLAVTQSGSWTVTANAGTNLNTSALVLDATLTNRLPAGSTPADNESNAITSSRLGVFNYVFDGTTWDRWTGAITISGTLPAFAATPTMNVGTFPDNEPLNVAQINGVTPLMGNGVTGTGSQRVTIASDNTAFTVNTGTFPDNEPFNVAQINGVAPLMGNGVTGTGSQRVTIASDNTAFTVNIGTFPDNEPINLAQIGGTTIVNGGLAGSQSVGGTAANNAAINQNPLLIAAEALSTQPAAATTGNQRRLVSALDGALYVRQGGPILWSCGLSAIGTTLTQCQAAPGASLSLYITDIVNVSNTSTAGLFTLRFGTGSNCGTGTGNLFFASASALLISPGNASTAGVSRTHFTIPIKVTANNAVCVLGVATNTTNIQINGFTAP